MLGTDFAASTAVPHQTHPRRTSGPLRGASAGPAADLCTLIHLQCCSRPPSRGRVLWCTALCPAAELRLVIKVTLEEDSETTHGSGGDICQTGGLQSRKFQHQYLAWPLPTSIGFQFLILSSSSSSSSLNPLPSTEISLKKVSNIFHSDYILFYKIFDLRKLGISFSQMPLISL